MMKRLLNQHRAQAQQSAGRTATTRAGIVSSYDPDNYCVKVKLQPSGTETGWIPVKSPWSGNGWGMFAGPSIGDVVEIDFQEGCKETASMGDRVFNDQIRPLPVPSGEFWLQHKLGQFIKLLNDGSTVLTDGHGAVVTLKGDGTIILACLDGNATKSTMTLKKDGTITSAATTWNHAGDINITGNTAFTGQVSANSKRIDDTHHHSGVTTGTGNTGAVA